MLTLLNRAANGNEMLAVIDGFSDTQPEDVEYTNQPTLDTIEFWYRCQATLCHFENWHRVLLLVTMGCHTNRVNKNDTND